jgi:hypothetical protein
MVQLLDEGSIERLYELVSNTAFQDCKILVAMVEIDGDGTGRKDATIRKTTEISGKQFRRKNT